MPGAGAIDPGTARCHARRVHPATAHPRSRLVSWGCLRGRSARPLWIGLASVVVATPIVPPAPTAGGHRSLFGRSDTEIGNQNVATDAAGDALVVWTAGSAIVGSVRPAGAAFGPPEVLVPLARAMSVAVGADGHAVVAWLQGAGQDWEIWARTARLPSGMWSEPTRVSGPGTAHARSDLPPDMKAA